MLSTFGLGLFWLFFKTIKIALGSEICASEPGTILVAGLCLDNNQPLEEFKVRLNRVITLEKCLHEDAQLAMPIILLGGLTGDNQISEAQAGANYLLEQGIDSGRIILEDQSRHTLENLQQARIMLISRQLQASPRAAAENPIFIITSRYHLYRVLTLANGLQMTLQPIAAEDNFSFSLMMWLRLLKEAYYLHWYWSGKMWVYLTANQKSKARIS